MRIQALAFDVFGTVVDWRGSIIAELTYLLGERPEWPQLADAWMRGYGSQVAGLRGGWAPLGQLLEAAFPPLVQQFGLQLDQQQTARLAGAWSRLRPWPDAVRGFARLQGRYQLAALTNADHGLLQQLAQYGGLPWDRLLSAQAVRAYKPDPAIYQLAVRELAVPAPQLLMVASHCFDLNAAHRQGLRTALIARPGEPGSDPAGLDHQADYVLPDLEQLASALG